MGFVALPLTSSLFHGVSLPGDQERVGTGREEALRWGASLGKTGGTLPGLPGAFDWDLLWFLGHGECGPGDAYLVHGTWM